MSEKDSYSKKIMELLMSENLTYKEITIKVFGEPNPDRNKLNIIATTVKRLKKRGLMESTGETRDRCAIYKPITRENMIFVKDSEFRDLRENEKNLINFFEDLSDKENVTKVLRGDLKHYQKLIKSNVDLPLYNKERKKILND